MITPQDSDETCSTDTFNNDLRRRVFIAARDGMVISLVGLLSLGTNYKDCKDALSYFTIEEGQKTSPIIIAARNGQENVVRLLLSNFDVDIEQQGTVKFDGFVIEGATALWCAAGAGHYSVVRTLVEHGADVNHATYSNSTPLRAACFDGRVEIVEYLLGKNADLSIANKYDNTCLMISSYKGHLPVVRILLERGADPNCTAHCGATALHFASECGHVNVIEELIKFGAKMLKSNSGMDPLKIGAEYCKTQVVEYFITCPTLEISELDRIEALELMGTVFANDKDNYNIEKAYRYLWLAMMKRFNNQNCVLRKTRNVPIEAYDNHCECQTVEELEAIQNNPHRIHMESLVVRERILGQNNPEITHPIIFRGAVFADMGDFDKCILLWMHALELRFFNNRPIGKDLLRFSQVFSQMVFLNVAVEYRHIHKVFHYALIELERGQQRLNNANKDLAETQKGLFENDIHTIIFLIALVAKVKVNKSQEFEICQMIYKFNQMNLTISNGYTPLHMAADAMTDVDDFHVADVVHFPSAPVTRLLIQCGAEVNSKDIEGNTPLHVIVRYNKPISDFLTLHSIIIQLCENGAHMDCTNNAGRTPSEESTTGVAEIILRTERKISLKCLAAKAVKSSGIPYADNVPKTLEDYINLH